MRRREASPQRKLRPQEISSPSNFKHVQHVGLDSVDGNTSDSGIVVDQHGSYLDQHHHHHYPQQYRQHHGHPVRAAVPAAATPATAASSKLRLESTDDGGFTDPGRRQRGTVVPPPITQTPSNSASRKEERYNKTQATATVSTAPRTRESPRPSPQQQQQPQSSNHSHHYQTIPSVLRRAHPQPAAPRPRSIQQMEFPLPPPRAVFISEGMQTTPPPQNNYANLSQQPQTAQISYETLSAALLSTMLQDTASRHFVYSFFYKNVPQIQKELGRQNACAEQHENMKKFVKTAAVELQELLPKP